MPHLTLDSCYSSKTEMADSVSQAIKTSLQEYGVNIVRVLITDIAPDRRVLDAMNEINANKRMREATKDKAEAEKMMIVK